MTVAQLIDKLKTIDQELIVASDGADCGGYDVTQGTNIFVEVRAIEYLGPKFCYIAHDGRDDL